MINVTFKDNTVYIEGEIDIFCAEEVKETILNFEPQGDFTVDMSAVSYMDSSGIGTFIALYNHYQKHNQTFHIIPSENVEKILRISKLETMFFKQSQAANREKDTIIFRDSFEADTRILAYLIDKLFEDLSRAGYPDEESHEIVVAVDEAITNAILETIKATGEVVDELTVPPHAAKAKSVAVRWEISPTEFYATIIDHGAGLDLATVQEQIPEVKRDDYLNEVGKYQNQCNLTIRVNGERIELKRLGAGLKIMSTFMDAIFIDLIDTEKSVSHQVKAGITTGTILNLYRKRRSNS